MQRICKQCLAVAFGVAAIGILSGDAARPALGEEAEPADDSREELFTEGRWLMDAADARRWQKLQTSPAPELRSLRDGTMPEFLQTIQRGLGGPLIERFDSLAPPTPDPTPWWRQFEGSWPEPASTPASTDAPNADSAAPETASNESTPTADDEVVFALAEATDHVSPPPRPVAALRSTAIDLDAKANEFEELELYRQADALRGLAQRLRHDARRLASGADADAEVLPEVEGVEPADEPLWNSVPPPTTTSRADRSERHGRRLRMKILERRPTIAAATWELPHYFEPAKAAPERSVLIAPPTE